MISMKSVGKVVGAACAATGVVALSGLVASGVAVGAVVEGFKVAAKTMKKVLTDEETVNCGSAKTDEPAVDEATADSASENEATADSDAEKTDVSAN